MKSKKVKCFTVVSLAVILIGATAYAMTSNQLSYVEKFETDKVDIKLQELSVVENGETAESEKIVEANKDVSYIPRIINKGADCYLRAKVEVVMDGECEEPLGIEHIYGINSDCVIRGDYFYFTKILPEGERIDLFEGIHIPEDWEYDNADGFSVNVRAEAIQSANFIPDFRKDFPWGAVSLQETARAGDKDLLEAVPLDIVSDVEFTANGGFQCSSAELFDEFGSMMPGDLYIKTVNIKNSAVNPMQIALDVTAGDNEINKKINIIIHAAGREIYKGTAEEADQLKVMDLIEIPQGETGTVSVQMQLPASIDNDYTEMEDEVVWNLTAEEVVDDSVQTGDDLDVKLILLAGLLALIAMMIVLKQERRGGDETSH